jgi:flagellar motor switch protein FliN/FliY
MATSPTISFAPPLPPDIQNVDEANLESALAPVESSQTPVEELALAPPVAALPVELDVTVPVHEFRVRDLLVLEPGQIIETEWGHGEDVPLAAGAVQLTWSEFEVVESQLAVRITRLA